MGSLSPPKNDVSKLLDFTLKNNKLSSDKNEWIQKNLLQSQKNIVIDYEEISGANHFYDNEIHKLNKIVSSYVERELNSRYR